MGFMQVKHHYSGISSVSNINLLGKVIEYRMKRLSGDPNYLATQQLLISYVDSGQREPWQFAVTVPNAGPDNTYKFIGALANRIIIRHPTEFIIGTAQNSVTVWLTPQIYYGRFLTLTSFRILDDISRFTIPTLYLLLPNLVINCYLFLRNQTE